MIIVTLDKRQSIRLTTNYYHTALHICQEDEEEEAALAVAVGLPLTVTSPLLTASHDGEEEEEERPLRVEDDDDEDGLRRLPSPPPPLALPTSATATEQGPAAGEGPLDEEQEGLVSFPSIAPEGDPDSISSASPAPTDVGQGSGAAPHVVVPDLFIPSPKRHHAISPHKSPYLLMDRVDSPHPLDEEAAARWREEAKKRRLEVRKRRVRRRCIRQMAELSSWWIEALEGYENRRRWMQLEPPMEGRLPSRYVYVG